MGFPRIFGMLSLLWVYAFFLGQGEGPADNPRLALPAGPADSFLVAMDQNDGFDDEPDACHSSPDDRRFHEAVSCLQSFSEEHRKTGRTLRSSAPRLSAREASPRPIDAPVSGFASGSGRFFPYHEGYPLFLISGLPPPPSA
jgi:hypothetical protein